MKVLVQELRQFYPDANRLHLDLDNIAFAHPLQAWFAEIYDEKGAKLAAGGHKPQLKPFTPDERMKRIVDALPLTEPNVSVAMSGGRWPTVGIGEEAATAISP